MTRSQFFKHFDLLAEQPDAVAKMRELVLQLAIQGRLLASDGKDKSARDLAARIRAAKKSSFPLISEEEVPFSLPPTWEWIRVGEAMNLINGRAFKPTDWSTEGLPIVRIQNLNNPDAPYNYCNFEVDAKVLLRDGDFLISWSGTPGTSFGAFIWNRGKAVLNQHIFRTELLGDAYTKEFLRLAVNGRLEEMIAKAHGAVGLQHITKGKLELLVLPLPPLAEQRRIVAKVDELMALCDELAARQQARHAARAQLQQSALHHLLAARDPHTFAPAWQRVRDHFHLLHDTPDAIPQLRQAIITLAIQGKLVPQHSKDEKGELILKRIKSAKTAQTAKSEAEESESFPAVASDETPFTLPASWTWGRLGEVAHIKHGYAFKSELFTAEPTPFVLTTPGNFYEKGGFRDRGAKTKYYRGNVPPEFVLRPGDLIIPMTEQAPGLLGSPAFIPNDGKTYLHNQRLGKLGFYSEVIAPEFASLFFNSAFFRRELAKTCTGMKVRHTSPRKVLRVPFPICSLAEQKRIVARVEALLRQCDALEAQLHQTRTLGAHLLDSTLHHLLSA